MPKSKKSDLTGVVMWAVIIALVAGMFWVAGFETLEKWRHPAQNGVPNVFQEDREYWSRVNSPIVAGNRLYLLFDALQLVKVYDLQGNYLYTVNMTNKNHHGISALYAKDDEMYFREQAELYCFKADQFVQRLTGDAAETMLETLRAEECRRTEDDAGNTYLLSGVGHREGSAGWRADNHPASVTPAEHLSGLSNHLLGNCFRSAGDGVHCALHCQQSGSAPKGRKCARRKVNIIPRGSRRSCRESLFLAKKSARIVKTAPDAGKKQENKHAAANKSEERKIR